MKRTLPLIAAFAASLAAPVAAQDISSILNPGNFAARLGSNGAPALAFLPADMATLFDQASLGAHVGAAVGVGPSRLAPRSSMAPIPRGLRAPAVAALPAAPAVTPSLSPDVTHEDGMDLAALMADAAEAAPEGSNTLVINGTNRAVIQSSPSTDATPRRGLCERFFGGYPPRARRPPSAVFA